MGGAVETHGDAALAAHLEKALEVDSSLAEPEGRREGELAARAHVHGFHTYPARLHPDTAGRLVASLSSGKDVVLDPFCGSGTVVVEAALLGRRAAGSDVNPLAVRLAALKVRPTTEAERAALVESAKRVALVAEARRKAKSGPSRRYPAADVAMFDAHVLLELDGLRVGLEQLAAPRARSDLFLVLSAILVKLSRRPSDTAGDPRGPAGQRREGELPPRRIAAGYPTRLFVKKAEELAERLAVVAERLGAAPRAKLFVDDARVLSHVPDAAVDLVVTSPPYPGIYDYTEHHAARLRWLGLPLASMEQGEIGSRRALRRLDAAVGRQAWAEDLRRVFAAFRRVMAPRGRVVLVMADAVIGQRGVFCDELIPEVADREGFEVTAVASQMRPHFHRPTAGAFEDKPRREHAILLSRARVWQHVNPAPRPRRERDHTRENRPTRGRRRA